LPYGASESHLVIYFWI